MAPPPRPLRETWIAAFACLLLLAAPVTICAGQLPSEPIALFDGRVRLSGDVSATIGETDEEAFFNYTDYERNALRNVRTSLSGLWTAGRRVAVLAELRAEGVSRLDLNAAYLRLRPWPDVPFDIQAGRVPPVFGAFGRRAYANDHTLIGYPLAYQYLTSIRPDAVPATADDLLQMRGRGWRSTFPIGDPEPETGVPLITGFRWDTGVQARWAPGRFEAAVAVTSGTLSNPRIVDDNGGRQIAGRVAARPAVGLVTGVSAARGAWLADDVPGYSGQAQTAFGLDAEYSRGYLVLRTEAVWSRWELPFLVAPPEGNVVSAFGAWIEGRYRLTPRIYLAARADRLDFSSITGVSGVATAWDAPVTRYEAGGGYIVRRNLVVRAVAQFNQRDGGRVRQRTYLSSQVSWWF
jgi:hypothetical protein